MINQQIRLESTKPEITKENSMQTTSHSLNIIVFLLERIIHDLLYNESQARCCPANIIAMEQIILLPDNFFCAFNCSHPHSSV